MHGRSSGLEFVIEGGMQPNGCLDPSPRSLEGKYLFHRYFRMHCPDKRIAKSTKWPANNGTTHVAYDQPFRNAGLNSVNLSAMQGQEKTKDKPG
jgi:hypothetical protein